MHSSHNGLRKGRQMAFLRRDNRTGAPMSTKTAVITAMSSAILLSSHAMATSDQELHAVLQQRFAGDRTGACVAAAVIERSTVATAYFCADPRTARPYDNRTAFEIGSVTKTMTATVLADLIVRGELSLDDPLTKILPPGTRVASFGGDPILLKHIVTHTSGLPALPPRMTITDQSNPYARVTEQELMDSLASVQLQSRPGTKFSYSNFAMMVLSYALAKRSGKPFEALLREKLLDPLQMKNTFIQALPPAVRVIQGHMSNTKATPGWDFGAQTGGVGGIRATLPDMIAYLKAQLSPDNTPLGKAITLTHQSLFKSAQQQVGMNWIMAPIAGRMTFQHDGGTGGYSSLVIADPQAGRGVILLSDTALTDLGGLGTVGLHLVDSGHPLAKPRLAMAAPSDLLDALVGRYLLNGTLGMELRRKGSTLTIQADAQPEFEMGFDSAGDFYPLAFDALLRPLRKADGTYAFTWHQLGGTMKAERISPAPQTVSNFQPSPEELKAYEGTYPLAPTFALKIFATGPKLFVQGTGQGPIEISPVAKDVFVAASVGAEITFERDTSMKVIALTLKQGGQNLRGIRQP